MESNIKIQQLYQEIYDNCLDPSNLKSSLDGFKVIGVNDAKLGVFILYHANGTIRKLSVHHLNNTLLAVSDITNNQDIHVFKYEVDGDKFMSVTMEDKLVAHSTTRVL